MEGELLNRVRNLVANSNRRSELKWNSSIFKDRNSSGVFVHAVFIRPFQWEVNREKWRDEELESIRKRKNGGLGKSLNFVRKLSIQCGMVDPQHNGLVSNQDYPYTFLHGDLIKLIIVDHQYQGYPQFRDNDGVYVVLRKGMSEYDLGIFPLNYAFDVMGSIHDQIKFDGEKVFPDAYQDLIRGGDVCHCSNEIAELILENLIPRVETYEEHPVPLYKDDPFSKEYGFICSEFEFKGHRYRFVLPFNLSISKLTLSTLKKAMKHRMDKNGFTCELIQSKHKFFHLFVHDYILVRGEGVYRNEIHQNLWDYFHTYDPERSDQIPKLKDWIQKEKDCERLEEKFFDTFKNTQLRSWSFSSLKRHGLRKSKEDRLQFAMDEVYAHSYLSPVLPQTVQ